MLFKIFDERIVHLDLFIIISCLQYFISIICISINPNQHTFPIQSLFLPHNRQYSTRENNIHSSNHLTLKNKTIRVHPIVHLYSSIPTLIRVFPIISSFPPDFPLFSQFFISLLFLLIFFSSFSYSCLLTTMLSRLVKATPVISNNFLRAFADAPKGAQAPPPPPPPDPDNTPIIAANNDNGIFSTSSHPFILPFYNSRS